MNYQRLPVDVFLERIADMPDIEAREQIVMRQDAASLEMGLIQTALSEATGDEAKRLCREITVIHYDNGRLKRALKEVNMRMDRIHWSKAVKAIYGDEGWMACRMWMEMNRG
jgi:hypothetical protein